MTRFLNFFLFLLVFILSASPLTAQWTRQYPLDKLSDVLDIDIHSDGYGFAVGTNDMLMRFDVGNNAWDLLPGFGQGWNFESVDYLEGSEGNLVAAGGEGLIISSNKGQSWTQIADAPADIHTINIFSVDHIIAIGDAGVFEWENGQWTDLQVPATVGIKGAFILDDQHIWVHTFATDPFIYYTTNGGQSWNTNTDINDVDVIQFHDAQNGIAADGRKIYNTNNGGTNWNLVSTNAIHNTSNDITFGSSLNALMAATLNADPAISIDGGLTWTQLSTGLINQRSFSIASLSDDEFWLGGDLSGMAYSNDQGVTWAERSGPERNIIQDVYFLNRNIGFAIGQKGMLIRTFDGGNNWEDISFGDRSNLSIYGRDVHDLWLGANQRIYHSVDTGTTWTESLILVSGNFSDLLALSVDTVFATTNSGIILRTVNAGTKWDTVFSTNNQIRSIARIDANRLMATGFNGLILRSEDRGATWNQVSVPAPGLQYEQTHFIDGRGWLVSSSFENEMWTTTNAGDSWTTIALPIDRFWDGLYFMSQDTGIIVGRTSNEGRVYITFNGGATWSAGYITTYPLFGVTGLPHPNGTAWIYGYGSDIEVLPFCNAFPIVSDFKGDLFPCQADTASYTVHSENIHSFNWHFPAGWKILGDSNQDTLSVVVGSNSGVISVIGTNDCGDSNPLNFSAGVDLLPVIQSIEGDLIPCVGDVIELGAINIGVDTFHWTLPSDWNFIDDDDKEVVLVLVGQSSGAISIYGANHCGSTEFSLIANPFTIPDVQVIVDENILSLSTNASSYQWYKDGELIGGATTATYIATQNGIYYAELVFSSGCSTVSETVEILLSGIHSVKPFNFSVYPVPANDKLFLKGVDGAFEYKVIDLSGIAIIAGSSANNIIDIQNLSSGFYLLILERNSIKYLSRFMKE